MKIHKGDEVLVIAGKDAGKRGTVRIADPSKARVVVEGVNVAKKHMRNRPGVSQAGIVEQEMPIDVSNVMYWCRSCNAPTRIGVRRDAAGGKERYCKRCDQPVERQ